VKTPTFEVARELALCILVELEAAVSVVTEFNYCSSSVICEETSER
jgi:hypothetical protein